MSFIPFTHTDTIQYTYNNNKLVFDHTARLRENATSVKVAD